MRFLFISTLYPNSVQPTRATYSRSLMLALREMGHEVRVIAPVPWCPVIDSALRKRQAPPKQEELDGITVSHPRFLNIPGLLTWRNHLAYRSAVAPVMRQTIHNFQPDHVSIGFAYPDGAAMVPVLGSAVQTDEAVNIDKDDPSGITPTQTRPLHPSSFSLQPSTFTYSLQVLGSDFRRRIRDARFKILVLATLKGAPLILCPGQALKRDMVSAGINADKIVSFNNGVDHSFFQPDIASATNTTKDKRSVLFVGNLVDVKGADRLLRAWARLKEDQAFSLPVGSTLTIIGNGPLEANLKKLCRQLNIQNSVEFPGRKPHDEIADYMRRATCLCLPSRSEGMPNVVLEALACGTPVVATAVGEVPYLIEDGINGFVITHEKRENENVLVGQLSSSLRKALCQSWDVNRITNTVDSMTWSAAAETVIGAVKALTAK